MKRATPYFFAVLAAFVTVSAVVMFAGPAAAQSISLDFGGGGGGGGGGEGGSVTGRIVQLILLMTVLSLAPSILVMVTSFTRIVIVLSLLRSALGLQQTPPNAILIGLALFLTAFIMAPTLEKAYDAGIQPLIEEKIDQKEAYSRTIKPLHAFMMKHVREKDLALFANMAKVKDDIKPEEMPLRAVVPAFLISELRRAFEIGFLLFVPFIIIDMVVASILMSMGMLMLPPITISLPFKLIFFVLVDGWYMVVGSVVRSFGGG